MTQKVLKVGTSAAVTLSKASLEELGVKIGGKVKVKNERGRVILESDRYPDRGDAEIAKLTLNFISRYRKDLDKLSRE